MKARRYCPPGIQPLELWDVLVDDQPLYLVDAAQQPLAIARVVSQLSGGAARRRRSDTLLPALAIERVVVAGGGPVAAIQQAITALGFQAEVADEPRFVAEAGGRALLSMFCDPLRGLVADVGQTSIKLSSARGRACYQRPLSRVPLELDARDPLSQPTFRDNTVAFIASALCREPAPEAVVLALPCEIDQALAVAGCSYPWLAGDPSLVADVLHAAKLTDTPCLVLNDAELAASSFLPPSVAGCAPGPRGTLVLTVGLGLGAAYLTG